MKTRHINYRSDFVIRERFRNGQGEVVALPAIDFELRYWVGSHTITASRRGGEFINCVADGDAILVIFKDHNLGEGELHHELHLSLDNALFKNGVQNIYYPESLHVWLWDKMGDTEGIIESDCVAAYTRGYKFKWEDFTAADIETLQRPATEAAERADAELKEFVRVAQGKSDTAVKNAQTATSLANSAADAARTAKTNADTATAAAKEATRKADTATTEAREQTTAATTATAEAKQQTAEAKAATTAAVTATEAAERQTVEALTATNYATGAGQQAATAAENLEATRLQMQQIIARAEVVVRGVPTGLKVQGPAVVTLGNPVRQYFKAKVKPDGVAQNVIYQTDGSAAFVRPSGEVVAHEVGSVEVHIVPTQGTHLYKTMKVEVMPPRIRTTGGGMRLDKQGNIRFT